MQRLDGSGLVGPLAPYTAGFRGWLAARGYSERTMVDKGYVVVGLNRWLGAEGIGVGALTSAVMDRFLEADPRRGVRSSQRAALPQLLAYLGEEVVVAPEPVEAPSAEGRLLEDYRRYLVAERGLSPLTVKNYQRTALWFLAEHGSADLAGLSWSEVSSFVLSAGRGRKPRTVNEIVGHLRSFLRYLHLAGQVATPLHGAAFRMPGWSDRGLPRGIPEDVAQRILGSCDRTTLGGARDFAMLVLVARLGLRAVEVARLELGDLDWRRGQVEIRGKGGARDTLPLPVEAGEALSDYLQRRGPRPRCRQVFLHVHASASPGVAATNVAEAMRRACQRAGVHDTGTHRFRHALATAMLARGAGLAEIGQVLRHQDLGVTATYAKVDVASLMTVAKPWPGRRG